MENEYFYYLERLAESYPTIGKASAEIINLQSIMNLPKGTEHFVSDIHGEYAAFSHVLKNGSGAVRKKIEDVFGSSLSEDDKATLATLIYYPREKMEIIRKTEKNIEDWYKVTLYRLIEVCKTVSSKYTRSKVRKSLPQDYAYIIEELITEKPEVLNKEAYYESIVDTIIELREAEDFITAVANLIQRLAVDHLHVLGDIFDRGAGPHLIMDRLCKYHSLDIQWGNHDMVWMGACAGNMACVATVIRNCVRYGNLDVLEEGYGINMLPLATYAISAYAGDPCEKFVFKTVPSGTNNMETDMIKKMHKAIAVIRFKLEGQLIKKWPEFGMEDRLLLEHIDYEKGTVEIEGREYKLLDDNFPTIDPNDPYKLTLGEEHVMEKLCSSFIHCEKLRKHVNLLLKKGSMYKVYNGNLLFHGCVPMEDDGSFKKVWLFGHEYSGKALFVAIESYVRKAFFASDPAEIEKGRDLMWFIWAGPDSPLYGRKKMATFERYLLDDENIKIEKKNAYYDFIKDEKTADRIMREFGLLGKNRHIINGHVPVHRMRGENPIKAGGKVIVIDGGFSKAYRTRTGIAGYTLIFNSYGLTLTAHQPFESPETAIREGRDMESNREAVQQMDKRMLVGDTDVGEYMRKKIEDLKQLIDAYRSGQLAETDK